MRIHYKVLLYGDAVPLMSSSRRPGWGQDTFKCLCLELLISFSTMVASWDERTSLTSVSPLRNAICLAFVWETLVPDLDSFKANTVELEE